MSDPRSNLGFESEDQLRAFIKALSNSAIPGKFAYVGEAAAATYDAHALTKEYGEVTRSVVDESSLLLEVWGRLTLRSWLRTIVAVRLCSSSRTRWGERSSQHNPSDTKSGVRPIRGESATWY